MSTKIIHLDDLSYFGEPTVQLIEPRQAPGVKLASEALDYIKNVQPQPGKTIILVLAMTAGEYYGPNRNGDAWPENPLTIGKSVISADDVLPKHYKTFETDAHIFRHHVNKDPAKSIGSVLRAFYNYAAHRVELLLAVDNEKAEDIVSRIHEQDPVAVSMGCRVPFDICSVCGNPAPTRAQYCNHAKNNLLDIGPGGRRNFVWNPRPKFFDISIVRRPADRLGWMMRKVAGEGVVSSAELGDEYESSQAKAADLRKMSLINKVIQGEVPMARDQDGIHINKSFIDDVAVKAAQNMPPIPDDMLRQVLEYKPAALLSTLSSMGILLTTPEFIKYFIWKMAPHVKIPEGLLRRAVALQSVAFDFLAENPDALRDIEQCGMLDEVEPNADIAEILRPMFEKRSQFGEYLYRHALPDVFKAPSRKGLLDTLTVQDPNTGRTYQTTRSAAHAAQDWAAEHRFKDLAGGGLLMGAAYKLLRSKRLRPLGALLALPGGVYGYRGAFGYPTARATTGERVSLPRQRLPWESRWDLGSRGGTELVEKRSSVNDGDIAITLALDNAHTGVKCAVAHLPKNAENMDFDDAAEWFGTLLCG